MPEEKYVYKEKKYEFDNDPFALADFFNAMQEGSEEYKQGKERYANSMSAKKNRTRGDQSQANKDNYYTDPSREKILDWLKNLWDSIGKIVFQMQQSAQENKRMSITAERKSHNPENNTAWNRAVLEALLAKHCEEQNVSSTELKRTIKDWLPYLAIAVSDYTYIPADDEQNQYLQFLVTEMHLALEEYSNPQYVIQSQEAWNARDVEMEKEAAQKQKDEKQKQRDEERKQQEEVQRQTLQQDATLLVDSAYKAYPTYVKQAVAELTMLCEQYATTPSDEQDEIKLLEPDAGVREINNLLAILKDKEKSDFKKFREYNDHCQQKQSKILSSPITGVKSFLEKSAKVLAVFFAAVAGLAGAGVGAYFAGRAAYNRLFPQNYFLGQVNKIRNKQIDISSQESQSAPESPKKSK